MRADVRCARTGRDTVGFDSSTHAKGNPMNSIIYIVGLVVIVGFILSYFGFR